MGVNGSGRLPSLGALGATAQIVSEGRGDMPAFGTTLTPEQIRDVSMYVIRFTDFIVN
jgi:mono/diheme cytochrome c family protein